MIGGYRFSDPTAEALPLVVFACIDVVASMSPKLLERDPASARHRMAELIVLREKREIHNDLQLAQILQDL